MLLDLRPKQHPKMQPYDKTDVESLVWTVAGSPIQATQQWVLAEAAGGCR